MAPKPTHEARAEAACRLCRARRRKTSAAQLNCRKAKISGRLADFAKPNAPHFYFVKRSSVFHAKSAARLFPKLFAMRVSLRGGNIYPKKREAFYDGSALRSQRKKAESRGGEKNRRPFHAVKALCVRFRIPPARPSAPRERLADGFAQLLTPKVAIKLQQQQTRHHPNTMKDKKIGFRFRFHDFIITFAPP